MLNKTISIQELQITCDSQKHEFTTILNYFEHIFFHLGFSQTHKIGNIGIFTKFVFPYVCSLILYYYVSKCEIRCQLV